MFRDLPLAILLPLLLSSAHRAEAQAPARRVAGGPPTAELRVDLLAARSTSLQAGVAVLWPASTNVSVGATAAVGVTRGPATTAEQVGSARAEVIARFSMNPDPAARWSPYAQATAGLLVVRGSSGRGLVSVAVGAAHSGIGPIRPAIELGLGGGLRLALVLRQSR